jgi:hypothetical protein
LKQQPLQGVAMEAVDEERARKENDPQEQDDCAVVHCENRVSATRQSVSIPSIEIILQRNHP